MGRTDPPDDPGRFRGWFYHPVRRARPRVRLFCFPHAGGGAAAFMAWGPGLPDEIEVWPVQPPGRQDRVAEPPLESIDALVAALLPAILPALDIPAAFFGHSLGAHVAFELARALRAAGEPQPIALFVSARRAPQLPDRNTQYSRLDDATLVGAAGMILGLPSEAPVPDAALRLAVPALRADLRMADGYRYGAGDPLGAAIVALGGADDPGIPVEDLAAWRAQTVGRFDLRLFPGGHFYLHESQDLLLRAIAEDLASIDEASRLEPALAPPGGREPEHG